MLFGTAAAAAAAAMMRVGACGSAAACCAGGVICRRGRAFGIEGAQVEQLAEQSPGEGEVCDENGGRGFAGVPEDPGGFIGHGEAVVLVEDGSEDDEDAQAEDAAEDELPLEWEQRADEHGQGDAEHDEVGGYIEDCVGDAVVDEGVALRRVGWNGPVLAEGATPCGEVEDFHDDEAEGNVGG